MADVNYHHDAFTADQPAAGAVPGGGLPPPTHPNRGELEPDIVARLEMLDDVIFAAIDGDPVAMEMAADAWHAALADLGPATVDESRQQYLRRARSVWESLRYLPNHPPHKLFAAIEIISLLSGRG